VSLVTPDYPVNPLLQFADVDSLCHLTRSLLSDKNGYTGWARLAPFRCAPKRSCYVSVLQHRLLDKDTFTHGGRGAGVWLDRPVGEGVAAY